MRLTVYTDYALRVLMYLALKEDRLATITEIADSFGISKNHLTKVAHQLGVAGYVETVRGRGGGLRLARPIEAIGLGEVVRYTEPDMAIVACLKASRYSLRHSTVLRFEAGAGEGTCGFHRCPRRLYPGRSCPAARAACGLVGYFAEQRPEVIVAFILLLSASGGFCELSL